MSVPLLDLKAQHATIRDEVVAAVMQIVDAQTFILGDAVVALEDSVAALSHTTHAIGCANGTDAILLALRALDIGRGDEVITTPFTFFATAGTIHNVGATPVFVDIEPAAFNISPEAVAAARTSRSRAVIPVDLFGQMAPIERIAAAVPGLPLIEDAAQSIGARRKIDGNWTMAGERATIGTFSFFPSKNLGGFGDGGMLVTQDAAIAERLRRLRVHGGASTSTTKSATTAVSTRSRPRCSRPSSRISPAGAGSAARMPRGTPPRSPTSWSRVTSRCRTSRPRTNRSSTSTP
jgi:dTDP-4-amino-4,6-dideoxygalactose transaminase